MNIAFVKLDKPQNGFINECKRLIRKLFNIIKVCGNVYYVPFSYAVTQKIIDNGRNYDSENQKCDTYISKHLIKKLTKMLTNDKVEKVLLEKGIQLKYPKFVGEAIFENMIPEVIEYCKNKENFVSAEVFVCTNQYSKNIEEMIIELSKKMKVVNVVSNNKKYKILEKNLENQNIFITVLNNKRKSLKNAKIVVNVDFKDFNDYNINRELALIDLSGVAKIPNGFEGKYIKGIRYSTNKVLRIFSEFENFEKSELLEAEISRITDYNNAREYVNKNKIEIKELIGIRG